MHIAHGFQRMCCWGDKCYNIVSISESTAVYVANHAAISRVFESSKQFIYVYRKQYRGKNTPLFHTICRGKVFRLRVVPRDIKGHATRNDIVDDIVDFSSSTMAFNVAKIASARASLTISLTKSLRVAGPLNIDGYTC